MEIRRSLLYAAILSVVAVGAALLGEQKIGIGTAVQASESEIGSALDKPDWTETWADQYVSKDYTLVDFIRNIDPTYNPTGEKIPGDYRLANANLLSGKFDIERGRTASRPWIISTAQEFAFFSRFVALAESGNVLAGTRNAMAAAGLGYPRYGDVANRVYAYAFAPYFRLGGNIDLGGKRWIPPYFHVATGEDMVGGTNISGTTNSRYPNRIYFYGNDKSISNAFVLQSYVQATDGTQSAYPSVLGMIPPSSCVRDLSIVNAYVSQGTSANPVSIVSQTAAASNTNSLGTIFSGVKVNNSVAEGGVGNASGIGSVNGIASNAGIIKNCSVTDTTFVLHSTGISNYQARGIGQASMFDENTVARTSIEAADLGVTAWSLGIGALIPATDNIESIQGFQPGFWNNNVLDSKITLEADTGTYVGHAIGVGICTLAMTFGFKGNSLDNSLVSVKINNDTTSTTVTNVAGMLYAAHPNNSASRILEITDNKVIDSTISVDMSATTSVASGMFIVGSASIDARIRRNYTENTHVTAVNRFQNSTKTTSNVSGIHIGHATLIEDCISSGSISSTTDRRPVDVHGISNAAAIVNCVDLATLDSIPEINDAAFPFQILTYVNNTNWLGVTPNVSIKRLTPEQINGSVPIEFTVGAWNHEIDDFIWRVNGRSYSISGKGTLSQFRTGDSPIFVAYLRYTGPEVEVSVDSKTNTTEDSGVLGDNDDPIMSPIVIGIAAGGLLILWVITVITFGVLLKRNKEKLQKAYVELAEIKAGQRATTVKKMKTKK